MKYVEVVKAVREEQMKKEASVKKLASLLKKKAASVPTTEITNQTQQKPATAPAIKNIPQTKIPGAVLRPIAYPAGASELLKQRLQKRIQEQKKKQAMQPELA